MDSTVFLVVGVLHLVAAGVAVRHRRRRPSSHAVLLVVVLVGLAYDNLVVASGTAVGESGLLRALNAGRFVIHAVATPMLVVVAVGLLRLAGVARARSRSLHVAACVLASALVGLGAWTDVLNLSLAPVVDGGVLRYVNTAELLPGPPIPAVTTILVVLAAGVVLWRATSWPWLALAATVMVATAGAVGQVLVQNVGEAVLAVGLVATLGHVTARAGATDQPPPTTTRSSAMAS